MDGWMDGSDLGLNPPQSKIEEKKPTPLCVGHFLQPTVMFGPLDRIKCTKVIYESNRKNQGTSTTAADERRRAIY